jgi:hypothetical protein
MTLWGLPRAMSSSTSSCRGDRPRPSTETASAARAGALPSGASTATGRAGWRWRQAEMACTPEGASKVEVKRRHFQIALALVDGGAFVAAAGCQQRH